MTELIPDGSSYLEEAEGVRGGANVQETVKEVYVFFSAVPEKTTGPHRESYKPPSGAHLPACTAPPNKVARGLCTHGGDCLLIWAIAP